MTLLSLLYPPVMQLSTGLVTLADNMKYPVLDPPTVRQVVPVVLLMTHPNLYTQLLSPLHTHLLLSLLNLSSCREYNTGDMAGAAGGTCGEP